MSRFKISYSKQNQSDSLWLFLWAKFRVQMPIITLLISALCLIRAVGTLGDWWVERPLIVKCVADVINRFGRSHVSNGRADAMCPSSIHGRCNWIRCILLHGVEKLLLLLLPPVQLSLRVRYGMIAVTLYGIIWHEWSEIWCSTIICASISVILLIFLLCHWAAETVVLRA